MRISDGSSDVCSSDLLPVPLRVRIAAGRVVRPRPLVHHGPARQADRQPQHPAYGRLPLAWLPDRRPFRGVLTMGWIPSFFFRSEERQVWEAWVSTCRSRWSPLPEKKKKKTYKM